MASLTMTTSLAAAAIAAHRSTIRPRCVVAKASTHEPQVVATENSVAKSVDDGSNTRRGIMFAAATAAITAVASKGAFADDEEPKRGTPEAKKKYGVICVTMPTARICHK